MLIPAMLVELVIVVEPLATKRAQRMAPKTRLRNVSRLIVAMMHMLLQFSIRKELMLVCEHFLVTSAQVAHLLVVDASYMAVQVWPAETSEVAV